MDALKAEILKKRKALESVDTGRNVSTYCLESAFSSYDVMIVMSKKILVEFCTAAARSM